MLKVRACVLEATYGVFFFIRSSSSLLNYLARVGVFGGVSTSIFQSISFLFSFLFLFLSILEKSFEIWPDFRRAVLRE